MLGKPADELETDYEHLYSVKNAIKIISHPFQNISQEMGITIVISAFK
jgi:hypothetical protein